MNIFVRESPFPITFRPDFAMNRSPVRFIPALSSVVFAGLLSGCLWRESELQPLDALSCPAVASAAQGQTATGLQTIQTTVNDAADWCAGASYPGTTVVRYAGKVYYNNWWANPGACPVEQDCPKTWEKGQWTLIDTSRKHEFSYYDYPALQAALPRPRLCRPEDYDLANLRAQIDQSILSGPLSKATPTGGWQPRDREALYREFMLQCTPDLASFKPANVQMVERVLTPQIWASVAPAVATRDLRSRYMDDKGNIVAWPAEPAFVSQARDNFLRAVARYPYYCGEAGYFASVEDACRREIAALLAHVAQEVGGGRLDQLFEYLREAGFVNQSSFFNAGCAAPFDCSASYARYYGRGAKQLTYHYNYANFSAMTFSGDFNRLLQWPDLVAYDGGLYFLSAIYFGMTTIPPKPSMHDVLLGRYAPDPSCSSPDRCYGLIHDPVTGVKDNFAVTIEVINGGVECRSGELSGNADNRSRLYLEMLGKLGVAPTAAEAASPMGCRMFTAAGQASAFTLDKLGARVATGLSLGTDQSRTCKAQTTGANLMVSVVAPGMVDACLKL